MTRAAHPVWTRWNPTAPWCPLTSAAEFPGVINLGASPQRLDTIVFSYVLIIDAASVCRLWRRNQKTAVSRTARIPEAESASAGPDHDRCAGTTTLAAGAVPGRPLP